MIFLVLCLVYWSAAASVVPEPVGCRLSGKSFSSIYKAVRTSKRTAEN